MCFGNEMWRWTTGCWGTRGLQAKVRVAPQRFYFFIVNNHACAASSPSITRARSTRKVLAQLSRSLQMAAESDWAAEIAAMQSESSRVAVDAVDASVAAAAAESAAAAAVAEAQLSEADLSLVRAFSALPDVSSDAAREISEQVESTTGYPLL